MRLHRDDRAIRNIIGFTLTFSIIVVSVGLVSTLGYQQLETLSQNERIENGEQAMELISAGLQQIEQQQSTVQTNELDISGGSLAVVDGPNVTVRSTRNFNTTIPVGGLRYTIGQTTFTYENGALFRTGVQGNTAVLSGPAWTCTRHRAVVSVVTIRAGSNSQFGGDSVTVSGTSTSSDLLFPMNRTGPDSASDPGEANVTVGSPRSQAWGRYLNDSGNWTRSGGLEDTYVCDGVEAVYVRQTVIRVSFIT